MYLPLAMNPDIQLETMKKLGMDGRSEEQRFLDEMNEERKEPMITLNLNQSGAGPDVNVIIDTRMNLAPKQNLAKPERSIQLM